MLEIRGLTKRYGGAAVLEPVSFQLSPGECLGITGPNGSGKSTLLAMVAQAVRPDGGEVLYEGRNVRGDRKFLRRTLGYVPQGNQLSPDLTVAQECALWLSACGLAGKVPPPLAERFSLAGLMGKRVSALSGGMAKRVSICLALAPGPRVLVLDEATDGLDGGYREALLTYVEAFLEQGGAALWCSHRVEELERMCTRCMTISQGKASWGR